MTGRGEREGQEGGDKIDREGRGRGEGEEGNGKEGQSSLPSVISNLSSEPGKPLSIVNVILYRTGWCKSRVMVHEYTTQHLGSPFLFGPPSVLGHCNFGRLEILLVFKQV